MILIVDDDHAITQVMKDVLTREGYGVRIAANGEEAYGILKGQTCRGMLLDLLMPGINGAGLLMLMAADGIRLPVIIMAGAPDFSAEELAEFPNVVGVMKKPFYPEEILDLVRRHMPKPSR
ncbi:MAG TPA: response regulator [Kiritimatiellia bacterium]|nr:response regulator [Kiritimatiellia bacterium]HMP33670.1 response regulator [Kiritimatiellia bacterium]